MRVTWLSHLILLDLIILTHGEVYKLRSSSLFYLLQPTAPSSLVCPNILLNLCPTRSVRDQVPHPYKTKGKNYGFVHFSL